MGHATLTEKTRNEIPGFNESGDRTILLTHIVIALVAYVIIGHFLRYV